eukprot:2038527-Amphidinium_carterae.1
MPFFLFPPLAAPTTLLRGGMIFPDSESFDKAIERLLASVAQSLQLHDEPAPAHDSADIAIPPQGIGTPQWKVLLRSLPRDARLDLSTDAPPPRPSLPRKSSYRSANKYSSPSTGFALRAPSAALPLPAPPQVLLGQLVLLLHPNWTKGLARSPQPLLRQLLRPMPPHCARDHVLPTQIWPRALRLRLPNQLKASSPQKCRIS